jgi:hypothetical protein
MYVEMKELNKLVRLQITKHYDLIVRSFIKKDRVGQFVTTVQYK